MLPAPVHVNKVTSLGAYDVSIPSRYEKQTPRKIPNEINGLLADFDGKTVAVPHFLNGLDLS